MIVIIDTSIALQWVLPESDSERADALLLGHDLAAPDVLLVESANVLAKKVRSGEIGLPQAVESIEFLRTQVRQFIAAPPLIDRALAISVAISHPVYDCNYLACAEALSGVVATRDRPFAKRATESGFADLLMRESAP